MPRIFGCLAVANLILLAGTAALGFLDPAPSADRHVLLSVITLLLTCVIQVLAFTYLTVTGKVIVQAVHLGRLDPAPLDRAREIKRSLTPILGVLVVATVILTATGAAAWRGNNPHAYHLPSAFLFFGLQVWAMMKEYDLLSENARLLEQLLKAYTAQKDHAA